MLRTTSPPSNEGVKQWVERLLKEEQACDANRRSAYRTPLVRPVLIYLPDGSEPQYGCSKNVSPDGIGLLLATRLEVGQTAKLRIHSVRGPGPLLLAELRWCDDFGDDWYLSGWRLLNEARP